MQKNGISLASLLGFVARNEYQCAHENRIKYGFSIFSKLYLDLKKNKEIQIDFHFYCFVLMDFICCAYLITPSLVTVISLNDVANRVLILCKPQATTLHQPNAPNARKTTKQQMRNVNLLPTERILNNLMNNESLCLSPFNTFSKSENKTRGK